MMPPEAYQRYEEYPRAAALTWEPKLDEKIEAEEHYQTLHKEHARLFSDSNHRVGVLESSSNPGQEPATHYFTDVDMLREHFERHPKPLTRHVFIEANNSRSPLNCSASMLKCVLTYHQEPPSFLKAVYAFGDQEEEPNDRGLASFGWDSASSRTYPYRADDSPDDHDCEECLWYLIQSVEHTGDPDTAARWPWRIRQAAVYHSFDFRTGRSFFLTIKGNGLFREQIQEHASSLLIDVPAGEQQNRMEVVAKALRAALATHLVYLSWCARPWGQFIEDSRSRVRSILDRAITVPLDQDIGALLEGVGQSPGPGAPQPGLALRQFRFEDLQRLCSRHHSIQDALLTVAEAGRVIKTVRRYYESKTTIASGYSAGGDRDIARFARELRSFCETLETAKQQLKTLGCKVSEGIELQKKGLDCRMWAEKELKRQLEVKLQSSASGTAKVPEIAAQEETPQVEPRD